tara:strand:- start:3077 stop:4180 length:1104 start_codon:yes stop_codon:yes gene_type:complete
MKVALVHDWLVVNGGAEKVLEGLLDIYPDSDIYTLVDFLPTEKRGWLGKSKVFPSFIQRLPKAKNSYRSYLPLFPIAIEQFDLSKYDLVISSSYAVAKGVITGPDQTHISYCHSPARYAWDLQAQYLKESGLEKGGKSILARYFLHKFRIWDVRSSLGVDKYVANSNFIAKRIYKCYRRKSEVIYPPVDISRFTLSTDKEDFYLTASRLVPYKRIDLVVEAFSKLPHLKLKVIGDGPEMKKIQDLASTSSNIEILGFQSDENMVSHMQRAKGFVFAAEEDFGIIPVEAQACGTPVIALGKGGCLETVKNNETGIHFAEQKVESLVSAIREMENSYDSFLPEKCRENAENFSVEKFKRSIADLVNSFD